MDGFTATLYQNLPFPVVIVDAEARLVSHNDAAARTFGWRIATTGGLRARLFLPGRSRRRFLPARPRPAVKTPMPSVFATTTATSSKRQPM